MTRPCGRLLDNGTRCTKPVGPAGRCGASHRDTVPVVATAPAPVAPAATPIEDPRPSIAIPTATGSEDRAWAFLLALGDMDGVPRWSLVGGLMVRAHLFAASARPSRATTDADVLVDIRAGRGGPRAMTRVLVDHFGLTAQATPDGRLHRFVDDPEGEGGDRLVVDLLGPDIDGADMTTSPPARTIQAPDGRAILRDVEHRPVTYDGTPGTIPLPPVGRAVMAKWRAFAEITTQTAPDRHLVDVACLVAAYEPDRIASTMRSVNDRRRMTHVVAGMENNESAWGHAVADSRAVLANLRAVNALLRNGRTPQ